MKWILTFTVTLMVFALVSCTAPQTTPTPAPVSTEMPQANMPNPASVFCVEQGFKSEIRTAADGSQSGVCIFPDGSECDEWAYFPGGCAPPTQSGQNSSPTEIPTAMPIDSAALSRLVDLHPCDLWFLDHAPRRLVCG